MGVLRLIAAALIATYDIVYNILNITAKIEIQCYIRYYLFPSVVHFLNLYS